MNVFISIENLNAKRNQKVHDELNLKTFRFSQCDYINLIFRRKLKIRSDLIYKSKSSTNRCMCRDSIALQKRFKV